MPTSLLRIRKQIEKLERQAETLRGGAIQKVRKLMAELGVTLEDLTGGGSPGPKRRGRPPGKTSGGKAKYRDPSTGKTWTGHGRAPDWIKKVADRSEYLIASAAAPAETTSAAPGKRVRPRKTPTK